MNWPFKSKPSILNEAIWAVLASMKNYGPDSQEYPVLLDNLERLMKMKAEEKRGNRVSPDTLASVIGGLLQVGVITGYEYKHLINQRALGFVINVAKPR